VIGPHVIEEARAHAVAFFADDATGHDAWHTMRVHNLAVRLAREEGAREDVVALAALLHDVDDAKLSPETTEGLGNAAAFLRRHGVADDEARAVLAAVREVSFSKNGGAAPSSLESACVRDADRLDAIGAIGVARAFAYGGARGRALHDPTSTDATTTIQHFYDKLLLLEGMMATDAGRRAAHRRDAYLRGFLEEFLAEWDGER
jgi:uncharacterized protein